MTVGQEVTIIYRTKVVRTSRSNDRPFLPPHGVGYGLGDGLGIILNRVSRRPPTYRATWRTTQVTGLVVEETPEKIVVEQSDGHRVKIRAQEIIRRTVTDI